MEHMNPQAQFCHNMACSARGKVGQGNIVVHSHEERRYKCNVCGKTFAATKGTPFYWLRHQTDMVVLVVTLLAYGCPVQAIVIAFGLDERTVSDWQKRAGQHCEQVHRNLVQVPRDLEHVQADEIRVKAQGHILWMAMAIMVRTRLWLGGCVSPQRDRSLIVQVVQQIRASALCRPLLISVDGLAAYVTAIREVFRSPLPTGQRGRPTLVAWPSILIGQVIKRYAQGHVVEVVRRMAQGAWDQALTLLAQSGGGSMLNVAYIERLNATFRMRLASLARRTRNPVRQTNTLHAAMYLVGCIYNFCTEHASLRIPGILGGQRKWLPRTPAMAAAITDHCWTVEELLCYRVPPPVWVPPKRRGRPPKAVTLLRAAWT